MSVASTIVAVFALGVLIALHEAGHFFVARRMGMKVLKYSIGFGTAIAKWTSRKTGIDYQIGVLPLGGFVQIKGMNPFEDGAYEEHDSYMVKPAWRRGLVILAGPLSNLLIAWLMLFTLFLVGNPENVNEARIGFTVPGGPAQEAGLEAEDRVLSIDGKRIETWDELAGAMHENPGNRLTLEVQRGKERMFVQVTPKEQDGVGLIGIGPPTERISLPAHRAAVASAVRCYELTAGTLKGLYGAITGTAKGVQTVGPVGIVEMASSALQRGLTVFLALMAYLSLMLFLFNLLPLPALDGGRAAFLLYEMVTRRRVSPKVDAAVNTVGFVLLIGLLILMSVKDIRNIFF